MKDSTKIFLVFSVAYRMGAKIQISSKKLYSEVIPKNVTTGGFTFTWLAVQKRSFLAEI